MQITTFLIACSCLFKCQSSTFMAKRCYNSSMYMTYAIGKIQCLQDDPPERQQKSLYNNRIEDIDSHSMYISKIRMLQGDDI